MIDIGEVIEETGIPASTLHLWERRGLLRAEGRTGLRRQYADDIYQRLAVIVICQRAMFSLAEIGEILGSIEKVLDKEPLRQKRAALVARRDQIDQAIAGLDHALECAEPVPLRCHHFQSELQAVFR